MKANHNKWDDFISFREVVRYWYKITNLKANHNSVSIGSAIDKLPVRRTLPRAIRPEMQEFFDELTQWVTAEDETMVAELMNVTRKHVHEVLRGRCQSYGVACMLVDCGKENRRRGVRRLVRNRPRVEDMEQLRIEFMDFSGKEG